MEHQFVDGLNASAAFANVFAYIIYIIKEVTESIQHRVG